MSEPLRLPEPIKALGRAIRDNRLANDLITRLIRTLARGARRARLAHRAPRLGFADVAMPNGQRLKLFAAQSESVHSSIFYEGWTGEEIEVLPLWSVLAKRATTILDIGAHIGHFSLVAGLSNRQAKIHSFEPHPLVRSILSNNLKINHLDGVTVHALALGRSDTSASFFVVPNMVPSSSSLSQDFMRAGDHATLEELRVSVRRLDNLLPDLEGPLLIKIDTETTEPDVIVGAATIIARLKPIMIVEILAEHDTGAALERELAAAGYEYRAFLMTENGMIRQDRLKGDAQWRNVLIVPTAAEVVATWGSDIEQRIHSATIDRQASQT